VPFSINSEAEFLPKNCAWEDFLSLLFTSYWASKRGFIWVAFKPIFDPICPALNRPIQYNRYYSLNICF